MRAFRRFAACFGAFVVLLGVARSQSLSIVAQNPLKGPGNMVFDSSGNLYIANSGYNNVVKVTTAGAISTVISSGLSAPYGLAIDSAGNLYVSNFTGGNVIKVPVTGSPGIFVAGLSNPYGMCFDNSGNLYVANNGAAGAGGTIVKVTSAGVATTFTTSGLNNPRDIALDTAGTNLWVTNSGNNTLVKVPVATGVVTGLTISGNLSAPTGLLNIGSGAFDVTNFTGTYDPRITVSNGASSGGFFNVATGTIGIAKDSAGNFYLGNYSTNSVAQYSSATVLLGTYVPAYVSASSAVVVDSAGNVYVASQGTGTVYQITPAGVARPYVSSSLLNSPAALALDPSGDLFVANFGGNTVVKVTPDGTASTFATGLNGPWGLACDSSGNLYVLNAGSGSSIVRIPSAGGAAVTITSAGLNGPRGLAIDASGNLYTVNSGGNNVIRVGPGGAETVLATVSAPQNVAIDASGNLYVPSGGTVVEVASSGAVSTFIASGVTSPQAVFCSSANQLYIADPGSSTIYQTALPANAATVTAASPTAVVFSASSQSVALAATVTQSSGTVIGSGTVTFTILNGSTTIASVTSGTVLSGAASANVTLPAGTAAGTYTLQAVYNAGTGLATSTDTSQTLIVASSATPVVTVPANVTVTATGPTGATATFGGATATDSLGFGISDGFELPSEGTNGWGYITPNGAAGPTIGGNWSYSYYAGINNGVNGNWGVTGGRGAYQGSQFAILQYYTSVKGSIQSVQTIPLTAGQQYTLTFAQASRSTNGTAGQLDYAVSTVQAQGTTQIFSRQTAQAEGWKNYSVTFTASYTGPASLLFSCVSKLDTDDTAYFDAVHLTTTGPVPATLSATSGSTFPVGTNTVTGTSPANILGNVGTSAFTVQVNPAPATITLTTPSSYVYDGTAKPATASVSVAGLTVSFLYDNSTSTPPTSAGVHSVVASLAAGQTWASATPVSGTYTIAQAPVTFTVSPTSFTYNGAAQGPTITPSVSGATYSVAGTASATGAGSYSVTPSASGNYAGGGTATSWSIGQQTVTITTNPTAGAITYGQPLSASGLSGGLASTAGTFAFANPAATPAAGTSTQTVNFTPADPTDYAAPAAIQVNVTVSKATPTITTAPTASSLNPGQTLSASTLSGGAASTPGTFAFTNPSVTPALGTTQQSVTFTPTDPTDYNSVTLQVNVTVSGSAPTFASAGTTLLAVSGMPFTQAFTVNATPAATFSAAGLPAGLAIDPVSGVISGTATGQGTYPVVVTAANSVGSTNLSLTLTVGVPFTSTIGLKAPAGVVMDSAGNLYVSNQTANTVVKIAPNGTVTTLASSLSAPTGLALDAAGNLYIANETGNTISQVTPAGVVSTYASSGLNGPWGLAVDASGYLYISNVNAGTISRVAPGGGAPTVFATGLTRPSGIAFGPSGNLFVANTSLGSISQVAPNGTVSAFVASGLATPQGISFDSFGNLWVVNTGTASLAEVTPAGAVSTVLSSGLNGPTSIAFDSAGTLYSTNYNTTTLTHVAVEPAPAFASAGSTVLAVKNTAFSQAVTTASPVGATYSATGLPAGMTISSATGVITGVSAVQGAYPVAVTGTNLTGSATKNFTLTVGVAYTWLNLANGTGGIIEDSLGDFYIAAVNNSTIQKFPAAGGAFTFATGPAVNGPVGMAVDASNNLYVANLFGTSVTKFTSSGASSTYATGLNAPWGLAFDAAGALYVSNQGGGTVSRIPAGGGAGTTYASGITNANGLAFDSAGNLYVTSNSLNTITEVTPAGATSTFVAANQGLSHPQGIVFDSFGNLYVVNATANTISEVTPAGAVSTAVSSGTSGLSSPGEIMIDSAGALYITNYSNSTVTRVGIEPAPAITSPTTAAATYGNAFSYQTSASNAPTSFTVTGLPTGLSANGTTGAISGTPTQAGTFQVQLTPTNLGSTGATTTVTLTVGQATPTVTWASPAAILQGTALSGTQLNASPSVPGTLIYSPAAGAVLGAGAGQTLSVTFTPTDTTDYKTVTATTTITVDAATTIASVSGPASGAYNVGKPLSFTVNYGSAVTVNTGGGSPTIALTIGGVTRQATYVSGSGTNALVFSYVIQAGDTALNGISVANSVSLNGATIKDGNGFAATTSFTAPTVSGVDVESAAPTLTWIDSSKIAFQANFKGYTGTPDGVGQFQTGATLHYSGSLPGWSATGVHAIHSVDLTGSGDYAIQIWQDNVLESPTFTTGNVAGTNYEVSFVAGPAVQYDSSQVTTASDGIYVNVVRADHTVLQSFTYKPGAWAGENLLLPVNFHYTGDGSGALHLEIGPSNFNSGHFGGELDDLIVAPASAYNPATIELPATSQAGAVVNFVTLAYSEISGDVAVAATPASGSTFPLGATPVTVSASDAAGNAVSQSFTVQVDVAQASVTLTTPTNYVYDGTAKPATYTTSPAGLTVDLTYDGSSANAPVNAGSHPVSATIDPSQTWVTGQPATGSVAIAKATPAISVTPYSVTYDAASHSATGTAIGVQSTGLTGLDLSGTAHTNAGAFTDTWTFTDPTGNYSNATGTVSDTIAQATASIAVSGYTGTYDGTAHTASGSATGVGAANLGSLLSITGAFANVPGGTVTWSFADPAGNYQPASGTASVVLAKANPSVSVTPYSVIYDGTAHTATGSAKGVLGETLSGLSLTGTTHTNAGTYADGWTYTDNTGNYTNANGSVSDQVTAQPATFTVAPVAFTYTGSAQGPAITASPANATYAVSGTGSATNAGSYSLTVTATGNYSGTSGPVSWQVTAAAPQLSWPAPAGIVYGTPLGAAQLNATANVPGTFSYAPDLGAVLSVGTGHTLTATFTPADQANYSTQTLSTTIDVTANPSIPVVTVPADITATATGPSGAVVSYSASATDALGIAIFADDFESPAVDPGSFSPVTTAGSPAAVTFGAWKFSSTAGVINGANGAWGGTAPYAGNQYIWLQDENFSGTGQGSIESAQAMQLVAGQTYTVWWAQASRTNNGGVATYAVSINTAAGSTQIFSRTSRQSEAWQYYAASFTATVSGPATVQFSTISSPHVDNSIFLDAISVTTTAAVPVTVAPASGVSLSPASGATFAPNTTTTVTATATNAAGTQASNTFAVSVVPQQVAITFSTPAYTYDGTGKAASATTNPGGLPVTFLYNGSPNLPISAGTYPVTAAVDAGWAVGTGNSSLTIGQANAVITVTPYTVTYSGTAHTATGSATGAQSEDLSADLSLSGTTHTHAGTTTDAWSFTDPNGNYAPASGSVTDHIAQAAATLTVTPYSVTYSGTPHTASGSATGVQNEPLAGLSLGGTTHTNAGSYADTWSFIDPTGNYQSAGGNAADVIIKANANPTLSALSAQYGNSIEDAVATTTPGGLTVVWSYNGLPLAITPPSGGSLADYAAATGATLEVSVTGASNSQVPAAGFGPYPIASDVNTAAALAGLVSVGQSAVVQVTISSDGLTYAFAASVPAPSTYTLGPINQGTYTVVGTVYDANYSGQVTAQWTITAAPLTVTADTLASTYGGGDPTLTYTVTGLLGGDDRASVLSGALSRDPGLGAGTYHIYQNTLAANGNYALTFKPATLTIDPAVLTVSADPQTQVYGAADNALTYGYAGLQYSDTFAAVTSGNLARAAGGNVGAYAITQGTLTTNRNYALMFVGNTLTITAAPLSVTANGASKVYGTGDPALTYVATGFKYSDSQAMMTGNLSRAPGESVGSYAIGLGQVTAGANYAITFAGNALQITAAPATIVANAAAKVYGTVDPTFTGTVTGFLAKDNVTVTYGRNAGESVNGSPYTITGRATAAQGVLANYAISSTPAAFTITQAAAAVTVTPYNVIYDGASHSATATVTGVGGVSLPTGDVTLAKAETHAGSYQDAWSFADASGNYAATGGTVTDVISKATPTLSATPYNVTFDGTAHTASGTVTGVGGASLGVPNVAGTTHTNAGTYNDTVTYTDATGNYSNATQSLTDVIAKAKATIVVTPYSVMYDGDAHTATGSAKGAGGVALTGLDLSGTTHTLPGSYSDTWTFTDSTGNYQSVAATAIADQIGVTGLIRQAITVNGMIDGSIQVLSGATDTLNGNSTISGDLIVPGTPTVVQNGHVTYAGTVDSTGSTTPSNYQVILNGNVALRHVIRRVNAIAMPVVAAPPTPTGTQSVTINKSGQAVTWSTANSVTLNGNVGSVTMPAGTYGTVVVNGNSTLVLGVAGASTPAVYNLQGLTINGNGALQIVGPVVINSLNTVTANGNVGVQAHPEWLAVNVASGGVTLNGNVVMYGNVVAPTLNKGQVVINGNSDLYGSVTADSLIVNGNGLLDQTQ